MINILIVNIPHFSSVYLYKYFYCRFAIIGGKFVREIRLGSKPRTRSDRHLEKWPPALKFVHRQCAFAIVVLRFNFVHIINVECLIFEIVLVTGSDSAINNVLRVADFGRKCTRHGQAPSIRFKYIPRLLFVLYFSPFFKSYDLCGKLKCQKNERSTF